MTLLQLARSRLNFAALHSLHKLIHGPSQADPRDECGPAQKEEANTTNETAERDIPVTGSLELVPPLLAIMVVVGFRPPAGKYYMADEFEIHGNHHRVHTNYG